MSRVPSSKPPGAPLGWGGAWLPAGAGDQGVDQRQGALVVQVAAAEGDGVDAGQVRQFVDRGTHGRTRSASAETPRIQDARTIGAASLATTLRIRG